MLGFRRDEDHWDVGFPFDVPAVAAEFDAALERERSLRVEALLVVVGLSTGAVTRLPRAGVWMVRVKKVFAIVMLGVAEYYLIKMGQLLI